MHSFVFEISIDCTSNCTPFMIIIKTAGIFNFQFVGLQPNSDPPTWVIGSNLHIHLVEGVATRLQESLSPYAVLGSELAPLPIINIKGLHLSKICMHHCDRKLSPRSVVQWLFKFITETKPGTCHFYFFIQKLSLYFFLTIRKFFLKIVVYEMPLLLLTPIVSHKYSSDLC